MLSLSQDPPSRAPPRSGSFHLMLRSEGKATRSVDLSRESTVLLQFWARADSLERMDRVEAQICALRCQEDASWTVVASEAGIGYRNTGPCARPSHAHSGRAVRGAYPDSRTYANHLADGRSYSGPPTGRTALIGHRELHPRGPDHSCRTRGDLDPPGSSAPHYYFRRAGRPRRYLGQPGHESWGHFWLHLRRTRGLSLLLQDPRAVDGGHHHGGREPG